MTTGAVIAEQVRSVLRYCVVGALTAAPVGFALLWAVRHDGDRPPATASDVLAGAAGLTVSAMVIVAIIGTLISALRVIDHVFAHDRALRAQR